MAIKSSSQIQDGRNRGGAEEKKKLKKLRSIKLSKRPSLKPSTRQKNSQFVQRFVDSSSDDASPIELSNASPNYMKATSCSDAKKENFQVGSESEGISDSHGSVSSTQSSQNWNGRIKEGTGTKKTLKKSRSSRRRAKSRFDRPSISVSSNSQIKVSDASPNLKATSCPDGRKLHFQASPRNSESSFGSNDQSRSQSNLDFSSPKYVRTLTRTSSSRPLRILINKSSFKSKGSSVKNCSEASQDLSVDRATCSSTLKDSKFPHDVKLHLGESEPEKISVVKVCPYNYCSLHGHHHAPVPPLKRLLSKRRRSSKTQKSMKLKSLSTHGLKCSGDKTQEIQTSQRVSKVDSAIQERANAITAISPVGDEEGMDANPRVVIFGASEEKEDADLAEILFGETSYPENGFQENLNQVKKITAAEQDILETPSKHKEISLECCCINTTLDKSISETTDTDLRCEEIGSSGGNNSTHAGNHSDFTDFSSPVVYLEPHEKVSTCLEEAPSLKSEFYEDDLETKGEKLVDDLIGEPSNTAKNDNGVISSASVCEPSKELSAVRGKKIGNSELDSESLEVFSPVRDSNSNSSDHEAHKTQFEKEKHISMWHLIHRQMVLGLAAEAGTQQTEREGEEKQVDDGNTLAASKNSGSCPGFIVSDQSICMENHDADNQEIEQHKVYAIKLVREAIEKILLPEVQDQPSDNQSTTSDIISDQELLEKNHGEGGESSISAYTDSAKDNFRECDNNKVGDVISLDPKESRPAADNISVPEEEKTASKVGNKSEKQTPSNWSYLKKFILLKRFIKELEKVKKFNPRKPRYLPLEPEPAAEKVSLRQKMMEKRKNSEEWMLDYALRQVVSEMAPTQKRKVALLVKAFETVAPPSEEQHIQVTFPKFKDNNNDCFCTESKLDMSVSETNDTDMKAEKIVASNLDNGDNISVIPDKHSDESEICMSMVEDSQLCSELCLKSDDIVKSPGAKMPVDEKAEEEVREDTISSFNLVLIKGGSELNDKIMELDGVTGEASYITKRTCPDVSGESTPTTSIASSASDCDTLEQLTAAREEKNGDSKPENVVLQGNSPLRDSERNLAYGTQLDKEKYIRMWHQIYQHVASGIAAKVGTKLLLDGEDEEEQEDDANVFPETRTSGNCDDYSKTDHDTGTENHKASHQSTEFKQSDAVKLVREAIDEILLPEIPDDSSDSQSITSDIIPEQELSEKNEKSEVGGGILLDQEEKGSAADSITTTEGKKAVSIVGNKSDQQRPKNWSKLKKLILLKRSIKALEKVRKFNPRPPQYLPLERDPEAEKVNLRHQMMEERKKAEQWMLDYALQHIVTKLTPARKRRVSMLVEAFEAVVPLPEI
uniref:Calmodulin-binding domain-containing protein n=1 Tax=Davidia involucrata TaxID=16924 RepID=A0A5B6ZD72_DAVIN